MALRIGFVAPDLAPDTPEARGGRFNPRSALNIALILTINSNARPLY
jgi:hypothetical protein